MDKVTQTGKSIHFGPYDIDLVGQEVRKGGIRIRLQPKPFQILAILLEHAGTTVSRDELKKALWDPDTFVDFDHGLNAAINKIRVALNDVADTPRFIETLPNGYRFIAPFNAQLPSPRVENSISPGRKPETEKSQWWKLRSTAVAIVAICLLAASLAAFSQRGHLFGLLPINIKSIAVLPLRNLSGDSSQDYFSDSMTDELITQLAKTSSLRVVSSASVMQYKNTNRPVADIERDLKVDALVEGSVLRSGDKVRITAQLIDAATDRHIWAEDYQGEMGDILFLENNIASAIATRVQANIAFSELSKRSQPHPVDPRAYDAYIEGRSYWFRRNTHAAKPNDLEKSAEKFRLALQYDPNYALAYAGMGDYYGLQAGYAIIPPADGWKLSEEASRKALSIDASLAEAHCALATKLMLYDWNWTGAEREIRLGLQSDPQYSELHHVYSLLLSYTGRFDESIAEAHIAEDIDPLSQDTIVKRALKFSRRYDLFLQEVDKTFAKDPARIHQERALVAKARKEFAREVEETDQLLRLRGCIPCAERLARAYANGGYRGWLEERLSDLKKRSGSGLLIHSSEGVRIEQGYVSPFAFVEIYADMGNSDMAMQYLEAAYREHTAELVRLQVNPAYDNLHTDPRFQNLVRRIGLPQ